MAKEEKATATQQTSTTQPKATAKKPDLMDRINAVLMGGRKTAPLTAEQKAARAKEMAARAERILGALEGAQRQPGKYSDAIIANWRYELNAIKNGTWTGRGMKIPKGVKAEPVYYAVTPETAYTPEQKAGEDRVDQIISD
jgi:hypothetical protein